MKHLLKKSPLLGLTLLAAWTLRAQPGNDMFANAWTLTGSLVVTNGSNVGASKEDGEPNHAGNRGGRSVWFNWTAPAGGQTRIDTIGSAFNTLLAVYTGNAVNALTLVAQNNDIGGGTNTSLVEFVAEAGTTYRIAVDASRFFGNPQGGNYSLRVQMLASVNITTPTNGAVFAAGSPIPVTVTAVVPAPPVTRVDLYRGGELVGTDTNAPFEFTVNNAPPGTNRLTAVAVDSTGAGWTSPMVNVAVLTPGGVTIVAPDDGTYYLSPTPITVSALEYQTPNPVTNVEFYVDGQKFGEDATSPFSAVWSAVTGGSHRLTAVGYDNDGNTFVSSPVNVSVAVTFVPRGARWNYFDRGVDLGTNWVLPGFDDSSWSNGPAELGYGDGDEATVVSFGPDPNNVYVTTYFRHYFVVTNAASYLATFMNVKRDDGAIVYLNGVEAARFNMPAGPVTYGTYAPNATDDGATFFPAVAIPSLLVEGTNVVAVEIHQTTPNSSDISFDMELLGIPEIIRNQPPAVALTAPTNNATFLAPPALTLEATASDPDGTVTKVEFYADNVKLGEDASAPYSFEWSSPPLGPHVLHAVATDNQGASQPSAGVVVTVYDAIGSPFARITSPPDGLSVEGPTNLLLTAFAVALNGVTNVQFFAGGALIGEDDTSPYSVPWAAPFGSHGLTAVAYDANGLPGTSAVVNVTITVPPTNTVAPTIAGQNPPDGANITNLTTIQVTFSEWVQNVDAADLLVNGVPATQVSGSGSNYTFTVPPQPYGTVTVSWATNHGITDFGWPSVLAFDENGLGATWSYNLIDQTPPTIVARIPAAGALLTNLTSVTVRFSEPVNGVDAADFLVNGLPATSLSGDGTNFTFSFSQPASGTVNISWRTGHGITDLAASPNPFNATGPGATWTYTLDTRTILVQTNSAWLFLKGLAEASSPPSAWRTNGFDDSSWSNALAPFYYGDAGYTNPAYPGTLLTDMQGNYSSIFLRKKFTVLNAAAVTNLFLLDQCDDGYIAWINGVEVARYNMPAGEVPYNGVASTTANEPNNNGAGYIVRTLPDPAGYLVDGENILAVHAFNQHISTSSDFGFNAQLYAYVADPSVVAPRIARLDPAVGPVFALSNLTVTFTEPVDGVDGDDLLVNGEPASFATSTNSTTYTFHFRQPPFGLVSFTWVETHGIVDFDTPPKPFDGTAPGSTFQILLLNPSAPTIASRTPPAGATVSELTQLSITFSEPVSGVDAADLLINGVPATGLSGSGADYTFTFAQPAYGAVSIGWAAAHGITDLEVPANPFDPSRPGSTWSYTLVDQIAPAIASVDPPAGAQVTNLTQVTVTFTEPVTGVDAADLRMNGVPALNLSGGGASYTFHFAQQNATVLTFTWTNNHGIRDLAATPNAFDSSAVGATWTYTTPDTLPPSLVVIDPPAFVTLRALFQIRVTFNEPVLGVDAADLLLNDRPALTVSGSGAGPYTFTFPPASNGVAEVRWIESHGITDQATGTPNPFGGGEWNYTIDPAASFTGTVLINEIMFNPAGGLAADEWIELRNVTTNFINLAGWRLSRGVSFTFPNVSLPPGGHLVVAADVAAFQAKHPAVTNVVGGWSGRLANSDETIELETAAGEIVNRVHYASEGDWARRERGHGAELVTSLTRNGATATATVFNHGFTGNDRIMISGADQPEYNGIFQISVVNPSTFTFTVPGTPASPATGTIIARHVIDEGASGWSWFCAADGFGYSLELVNPALPNTAGQNWLPSANVGGTPGVPNSVASTNVAPLLLDVAHFPPVPKSTDPVAITARVVDEQSNGVQAVTLFFRNHTGTAPGPFLSTNMFDDGGHSDGLSGDGLYGAVLPAFANGTIIEFYVQASDTTGLTRTWPAPTWDTNNTFGQLANALYQVDNETITNPVPIVRLVLSGSERAVFPPASRNSDAEMNTTFISTDGTGTQVRYLCGVRVRGAGSRTRTPPNNRLNIPNDNRWNGLAAVNLNGQFIHAQIMGAAVARQAGVPAADAHIIQYRINGANPVTRLTAPANGSGDGTGFGAFILLQPVNGDLAADLFPQDGDGNVYRASTGNHSAQFNSRGTNGTAYLADGYFKTSNQTENDWTDLANLTAAMSYTGPDSTYLPALRTNANIEAWMRYFALGTLINYGETSLFNGRGDDYALYRGLNDPRFVLIGHDFDTIFGQGDTVDNPPGTGYYPLRTNASPYIMINPPNTGPFNTPNVNLLRRFMTNAEFAPIFFGELKRLCDTTFHPSQLNPLFDQLLSGWGNGPSAVTISAMKNHAASRRLNVLAQIPLTLTVGHTLSTSLGFPYTTSSNVTLFGSTHAIDTRKVLVNGATALWSAWDARWTNVTTLRPGINRVLVQSLNSNNVEFARATLDIWYDDGSVTTVSGTLNADTHWAAASGPYQITASLTVAAGVTLTIEPGTSVYLSPGASLIVANGGRLLAEGTDTARIRFGNAPGAGAWGGITLNGGPASPESRIAYAHFENNGSTAIQVTDGTVFLDHLTFGNTGRQYLSLDRASFVVQDCVFPAPTAGFEPTHGSGGIKAGGRGIFRRNFWGRVQGYNDALDFTGGNRPGPILQVLNNVFMGSDDDLLDLDSTDAWIEGNIFLHTHRNGSPDSASAISGGSDNPDNSQITIVRNLFFDVDHVANAKQTNFYTLINNTIVHQTRIGSQDTNTAVVILADDGTSQGAGMWVEGNIILDAENLTRNLTTALVTFTNNLIFQLQGAPWTGPGGNNIVADPLLKRIPPFSETTNFTSWAAAQVMWDYFSLKTGSPARGAGPNGRDLGGVVPAGVSVSGEPVGTTPLNYATLQVGLNRGPGTVPTNGFPLGSGFTHYKWRLDGGPWSAETPLAAPIILSNLSSGPHFVEVVGRNDAGFYQDDPVFGPDAVVTLSRTWTVDAGAPPLRLNEVLAANTGALNHHGTTPDAIELYNLTDEALDLEGVRLTDDPADPDKFLFPAGASIPARGYLVVFANNPDGTPGYHLGFNLNQNGDALYLFAPAAGGGALLDSVTFGMQLPDLSIGRLDDGTWALTQPTFGGPNRAAPLGDPRALRINEWLAIGQAPFDSDFIELLNTDALPVALGGLFISDEPLGWPTRHPFAPLSFVAGQSYLRLFADGNTGQGPDHLGFALAADHGALGLFLPDLAPIDFVWYQPQQPNISQGRSPNGSSNIVFLATPTPGAANPNVAAPVPFGGALVINEVLAANASLAELDGRTPDWVELYNGTTNTVDLGDLSLSDNTTSPRKFVFPAGTTLAPGAFLRVLCDPGTTNPGPLTTTNFALSAAGGGVFLFDTPANGGGLITAASIVYGLQTPDLSIGRVPDGGTNWTLTTPTPLAANVPVPALGEVTNLTVNEWLANPLPGADDWFEIYNPNPLPVALGGLHLTDDLNNRTKHRIPALSFLGTGTNAWQKFIADRNTGAGADHVNFRLDADQDSLGISTAAGTLINGVTFSQQTEDVSQGRFPDGGTEIVAFPGTDSPGASNWRRLTNVVINEALTHTDLPLEDAIELHNLTDQPLDIGGWWLSDDPGALQKYQIPSPTILPPYGFVVIYENQFTNREIASVPFALSSRGDEIVLSAYASNALTGWRTKVDFGPAASGVSFGRYVTSDGREHFVPMSARTFGADDPATVEQFRTGTGASNALPRIGPVVITEIMYHPPDLGTNDNTRDEFIELRNITTAPVALYDGTNGWRLRDAVDFDFPPGTVLPPGDYLLVVGFDPTNNPAALAAFRARYHVDPSTRILGPWSGKLANDTEDIELRRPDVPDPQGVAYLLVERVRYADAAPWPAGADGTGWSLQRRADNEFANDPANWVAAEPTPGPQAAPMDSDGDGLPDAWEILYGFDPFNPNDAALDSDGDGLTNLQEYLLGSNPRNPAQGLRLNFALAPDRTSLLLRFEATADFAYTIESADSPAGPWSPLETFGAAPTNRVVERAVALTGPMRFYRLRMEYSPAPFPLQLNSITPLPGNEFALTFNVPAQQTCTVLFAFESPDGPWSALTNYPAAPTNRVLRLVVPVTTSSGFYRLRAQ